MLSIMLYIGLLHHKTAGKSRTTTSDFKDKGFCKSIFISLSKCWERRFWYYSCEVGGPRADNRSAIDTQEEL